MLRSGMAQVVAVGLSLSLIAWNVQLLLHAPAETPLAAVDGSQPRPGRFPGEPLSAVLSIALASIA